MNEMLSVIKADIGSIGGHIAPSKRLLERVKEVVETSGKSIITDHHISHTGDDIAILMTHRRGEGRKNPQTRMGSICGPTRRWRNRKVCMGRAMIC